MSNHLPAQPASSGGTPAEAATVHTHEHPGKVLHALAPLVAIGATWALRRAMNLGYKAVTGSPAPKPDDPTLSWARAFVWAAATASAAAVVEVAIFRYTSRR